MSPFGEPKPRDEMTLGGDTLPARDYYQRVLRRLRSARSVLDIGCGNGALDVFLAREGVIRITGLDISTPGFGDANKTARADGVEKLVACVKGWQRSLKPAGPQSGP